MIFSLRTLKMGRTHSVPLFLKAKEERVAIQWPPHLILIARHRAHFKHCLNVRSAAHESSLRHFFELARGLPGVASFRSLKGFFGQNFYLLNQAIACKRRGHLFLSKPFLSGHFHSKNIIFFNQYICSFFFLKKFQDFHTLRNLRLQL
jgi:hypothetical protein